jgi:hypothetical protein
MDWSIMISTAPKNECPGLGDYKITWFGFALMCALIVLALFLDSCASYPVMEVPADDPECHEEMPMEKEASYQGCVPTCSKDGSVCYSNCAGGVM